MVRGLLAAKAGGVQLRQHPHSDALASRSKSCSSRRAYLTIIYSSYIYCRGDTYFQVQGTQSHRHCHYVGRCLRTWHIFPSEAINADFLFIFSTLKTLTHLAVLSL